MTTDRIARAAHYLLDARAQRTLITALPQDCRPLDVAQAYAIQDAVAAGLGPIGGWKVGAAAPDGEPNCAPLPASGIIRSPARLLSTNHPLRGIEAEIAYRFKQDLPPKPHPYTLAEVLAAIASVHPVIEVVESRFTDRTQVDYPSALADALGHGVLIYGEGREQGFNINQLEQPAQLMFDDDMVVDTRGANPAGDVLRLLVWLANHVAGRHGGIRAGQIVTTGSCSGIAFAEADSDVSAHLQGLGWVRVAFC
ncbi:2-keto-4-pentenoate hydratase [Allopusillimonas ginsengisoli]|uniref:2-keto-4-pentenoate hydratase n=1 Tax=Allopusillimonas ginsengisoli TaxID=453575 RepID=UPI00101F5ABF|nr:2-keto-4-pentenoate hydratase [Allopusillimonas ginsengisoli]TEA77819.1 2-keto-4-pentenoate hydratase [Allopusillimonas ginsengisoli]